MERGEVEVPLRAFEIPALAESKYQLGVTAFQGRLERIDILFPARTRRMKRGRLERKNERMVRKIDKGTDKERT
jgi:hypothetical protein